jgi:uncharacterized membrane protein YfcA
VDQLVLLCVLLFGAAFLYSAVGHAGASGYLAAMGILGLDPAVMKPTALVLNILVASMTFYRFRRAGFFRWRTVWPFLIGSIPFAFVGGAIQLPAQVYRILVGMVLLFAAYRLVRYQDPPPETIRPPPVVPAIFCGVGLGLLSGLTGTGGGIFLSPLLLLAGWAETRSTAGVAACFILCNSIAGLGGNLASMQRLPHELPWYVASAAIGGAIGAYFGSTRFSVFTFRKLLAGVLVVAAIKLLLF